MQTIVNVAYILYYEAFFIMYHFVSSVLYDVGALFEIYH